MKARLDVHRPLAAEGKRLFVLFVDMIADGLLLTREDPNRGHHDARKAVKKARALLKLLREADAPFYKTENARLRDLARSLSQARDAAAMVETAERLTASGNGPAKALAALHAALVQRCAALQGSADTSSADGVETGLAACVAARRAAEDWRLPEDPQASAATLANGLKRNRKILRRAARAAKRDGADDDFHELRKAMKADWTHRGVLRDMLPAKEVRRRAAVKDTAERLGELNDLADLQTLLKQIDLPISPKHRSKLLKYIGANVLALRKQCLAETSHLYCRRHQRLRNRFEKIFRTSRRIEHGNLTGPGEGLSPSP